MKSPIVPLPILNNQVPVLLIFDPHDPAIELAYERAPLGGSLIRSVARDAVEYPGCHRSPGSPLAYWIPRCTPVFAAGDGKVIHARAASDGHAILIDHGGDWIGSYSRLRHSYIPDTELGSPTVEVHAGQILGYIGARRGELLSPLRFELWRYDEREMYVPIDPLLFARRWRYQEWHDKQLARAASDAASSG